MVDLMLFAYWLGNLLNLQSLRSALSGADNGFHLTLVGLKFKPEIKPGLNKVIRPFFFYCFKRFWNISSYRPVTASNSWFKKEAVFKKLKLVT